jgi:hypothetical protein
LWLYIEVSLLCILLWVLRTTCSKLTGHKLRECHLHYNIPVYSLLVRCEVWNKRITSFIYRYCFVCQLNIPLTLICNNPTRFNKIFRFIYNTIIKPSLVLT